MHRIGQVVSLAAGVLLLVVGGVWPLLSPEQLRALSPIALWVGPLATAIGTALLATNVTEFHRFQQAKRMLGPHLSPVCSQFAILIMHLRQAVLDLRDGRLDPPTASVLLAEQSSIFESTLMQLSYYSGAEARAQPAGRDLQAAGIPAAESSGAARGGALQPAVPTRSTCAETVECPYCHAEQVVELGTNFGDSATPQCASCSRRFHVYRDRYGDAYANPWGGATPYSFLCPQCSRFEFQVGTGRAIRPRWCLECFARVWPHPEHPRVIEQENRPLLAQAVAVLADERTVLECPSCHGRYASFVRYKNKLYAECTRCDRLLEEAVTTEAPNTALQPTAGAKDQ